MSDLLHHFDINELGRDFVVGDLHGCIDHFERLLDQIEFDAEKDRMFSVGDLVDRGPDSMACLRLLKEPWFHAVLGNHEDMMLDAVSSNLRNGVPSNGSTMVAIGALSNLKTVILSSLSLSISSMSCLTESLSKPASSDSLG